MHGRDHKPLETFDKGHDGSICKTPKMEVVLADCLSRAHVSETEEDVSLSMYAKFSKTP